MAMILDLRGIRGQSALITKLILHPCNVKHYPFICSTHSLLYVGFSGAHNQSKPVLEGLIRAGFSIPLSLAFSVW